LIHFYKSVFRRRSHLRGYRLLLEEKNI